MAANRDSFRGCHRSAGMELPLVCIAGLGLAERDELSPYLPSSSGVGIKSGWKAGNRKVALGLGSRARVGIMAVAVYESLGVFFSCTRSLRHG